MERMVNYMLDKEGSGSTSSILTNGINIIIELIRRYCSEIEQAEFQQHSYQQQTQLGMTSGSALSSTNGGSGEPNAEKMYALGSDLVDLLVVLGNRLGEFAELLERPRLPVRAFPLCLYISFILERFFSRRKLLPDTESACGYDYWPSNAAWK